RRDWHRHRKAHGQRRDGDNPQQGAHPSPRTVPNTPQTQQASGITAASAQYSLSSTLRRITGDAGRECGTDCRTTTTMAMPTAARLIQLDCSGQVRTAQRNTTPKHAVPLATNAAACTRSTCVLARSTSATATASAKAPTSCPSSLAARAVPTTAAMHDPHTKPVRIACARSPPSTDGRGTGSRLTQIAARALRASIAMAATARMAPVAPTDAVKNMSAHAAVADRYPKTPTAVKTAVAPDE